MPKGRPAATLAALERRLSEINVTRHRLIVAIRAAVDHLTTGGSAGPARPSVTTPGPAATARPRRQLSPEARRRLSQLAKARWAKAKKAGKSRLG
jgi:hypothetical protein